MRNAKKCFFNCFFFNDDIIQNTPILLEHDEKQNSLLVKCKFTVRLMQVYTTNLVCFSEMLLTTIRGHNSIHLDWLESWPGQKWQTMRDKVYFFMWRRPYCTDLIAGCPLKRNNSLLPPNSDYLSDQTLNLGFIQLTLGLQKDKNKLKEWEEIVQVASCAVCITSTCCGVISVIYNQPNCVTVC